MIESILDNYLVIDVDVFFLKPVIFMQDDKAIFSTGNDHHIHYFTHIIFLYNNFSKVILKVVFVIICYLVKKYIDELFAIVEEYHKNRFGKLS